MYVKTNDKNEVLAELTLAEIRQQNPKVSLPRNPGQMFNIGDTAYVAITPIERPDPEPGKVHIPDATTFDAQNNRFVRAWITRPESEREQADNRSELFAALASARYQKEISGISVGPYAIATDDRSKLLLNGAYTDALRENDNKRVRKFSLGAGVYIDVTNAEIIGIAAQVADHVQRCFDAAAQVADQIISENITTTAAIKTALDYAYDYPETPAKE